MLTSQRSGNSQTFLPVVRDHMAPRNAPSPGTRKKNRGGRTKLSKELIQKHNPVTPQMAGCLHWGGAELGMFSEGMARSLRRRGMCPHPAPGLGEINQTGTTRPFKLVFIGALLCHNPPVF